MCSWAPNELQLQVVAAADADEHAGRAAAEPVRRQAGVLERLPRDFEQQPLLRVHAGGLARRDAEERGIEPVDAVDEAAPARACVPGRPDRGRRTPRRPSVRRDRRGSRRRRRAEPPERLGVRDPPRKAAADPDDGDRLALRCLVPGEPAAQLADLEQRSLGGRQLLPRPGHRLGHVPASPINSFSSRASASCSERPCTSANPSGDASPALAAPAPSPSTASSRWALNALSVG